VIVILPEAMAEAREARLWYAARSPAAAADFMADLDRALVKIDEGPDRWPSYDHGTRRFLLHRFPFSVVYRVRGGHVLIVAVAHAKRNPGYWRRR